MDHAEAREGLELAAAEPGGLDRLMAGDTPVAAALAGHIAGCESCAALVARLRRDSLVIGDAVRTMPPADLRARTLAYVGEVGRLRGAAAEAAGAGPVPATAPGSAPAAAAPAPAPVAVARPATRLPLARLAAIAAVVAIVVAGSGLIVAAQRDAVIAERNAQLAEQSAAIERLSRVMTRSLAIAAQPDARRVALSGTGDGSGSVVFSGSTGELSIVVEGLPEPPDGQALRCWLEVSGERHAIGQMVYGGELSFWAGPVGDTDLAAVDRIGVSLVDANGDSVGDPVLSGEL